MTSITKTTASFLAALFDEGESLCLSATTFGIDAAPDRAKAVGAEFVSLNSFQPGTRRADRNVSCFRNFLFEMDSGSLDEQASYFEGTLALPFTTKVFSGGKSFHYVLSLEEPLASIEEYAHVAQLLFSIAALADQSNKNPSRFTRLAGAKRADKGFAEQALIATKARVSIDELTKFLTAHEGSLMRAEAARAEALEGMQLTADVGDLPEGYRGILTLKTKNFIAEGAMHGARNRELYIAAADFKNNLYMQAEALEALMPAAVHLSGLSDWEARNTVRSAFRSAPIRVRTAI